jgi:outer membrane protein OmpA-like peptidoglycan-associated protein
MEIEAWGKYAKDNVPKIDLTGDWESNWGLASIRQTGSNIDGCYAFRNGVFKNAGMDRRILTYEWVEEEANAYGHGVLVVSEDGTRLNGIWGFGDDLNRYGIWVFRKKSSSPSLCYADNRSAETKKTEDDAVIERMKTEIEAKGKLIIYGINFETNSATIKEESYSTLNEIYGLLLANEAMKLKIEGHTDNIGSHEENKKLSLSRSESVKSYLTDKGVAKQRLVSFGKGEEFPMADNGSQLGRAANRRVELVLQ